MFLNLSSSKILFDLDKTGYSKQDLKGTMNLWKQVLQIVTVSTYIFWVYTENEQLDFFIILEMY